MGNSMTGRVERPKLESWKNWSYRDYLAYFLSGAAAKSRLGDAPSPETVLSEEELRAFCAPIRERIVNLYSTENPRVSIVLPAFNEDGELLATLVSYTMLDIEPGVAEFIVANNNSTDSTPIVIDACGIKGAFCKEPGVGYARDAAYRAMAPSSEYVWMSDADCRVTAPANTEAELERKSTVLKTNLNFMDEHPDVLGISSGGRAESAYWLYMLARKLSVRLKRSKPYSSWAGWNQFVRRDAMDAIGGIDPEVQLGDDHYRHHQLAVLAKEQGKKLASGNGDPRICDPVYFSGRRFATLSLILRHYRDRNDMKSWVRDEFGIPVPERHVDWRFVRGPVASRPQSTK